jgi:bifunctional DNA-binding transcriptional regulator/antitoxin component of YhaV-PrlF toxin-antitoxin module
MPTHRTKLTENGSILIPPEYLQAIGLQAGDEVILWLEYGVLCIFTPGRALKHTQ